jgi:hypothetical protein
MSASEQVRQAIQLLQAGKRTEARELLKRTLAQNKDDVFAWAAMVRAAESREEAVFCLKQVLRLKPDDSWAINHLRRLEGPATQPASVSKHVPPFFSSPEPDGDRAVHPQTLPAQPGGLQLDQKGQTSSPSAAGGAPKEQAADLMPTRSSSPLVSLLNHLPWIAVGLSVFVCLIASWYEFLAPHPGDEEKVRQAAEEWTVAMLRSDYDAMLDLVCKRYETDIKSAESMAGLLGDFGMTFERQPSAEMLRGIKYEVVSVKGNRARVRVSGGFFAEVQFLDDSFAGGGDYMMMRELGKWKWCGRE